MKKKINSNKVHKDIKNIALIMGAILIIVLGVFVFLSIFIRGNYFEYLGIVIGYITFVALLFYARFTYGILKENKKIRESEFRPFLYIDNPDQFKIFFYPKDSRYKSAKDQIRSTLGVMEEIYKLDLEKEGKKIPPPKPLLETYIALSNIGKGAALNFKSNYIKIGDFKVQFDIPAPLPAVNYSGSLEKDLFKICLFVSKAEYDDSKTSRSSILALVCYDQLGNKHTSNYKIIERENPEKNGVLLRFVD